MVHIAFYKFVPLTGLPDLCARLMTLAEGLCGSILVAEEGINGMLAGDPRRIDAFEAALVSQEFRNGAFAGMVFKRTESALLPFKRLKVRIRPEIVPLGIMGVDGADTGTDVPPEQWRELIARDDVVLIDNRNRFEIGFGRFRGAIDPGVDNFRDFPEWIKAQLPQWQSEGKSIAMYCTGGIRCEKTSAWMKQALGVPVFQLQGGILNWFQSVPDPAREFDGDCFVFDEREVLSPAEARRPAPTSGSAD